jgi:tetratricopeptide (TPR) repeat protein
MNAAAELLSGTPRSEASRPHRSPFETTPAPRTSPVATHSAEPRVPAGADLFATATIRDTSRTHLAFSTSRARSSEGGHGPRLGSAFATLRPAPSPASDVHRSDVHQSDVHQSDEASAAQDAFELGHTRFEQRDYDGALDAWRAAVELMPNNRTYQANLRRLERLLEPDEG